MTARDTLRGWNVGIRILQIANHNAASHYSTLHRTLGLVVVVFTTLAGTTVLSTMKEGPGITLGGYDKLVVGVVSIVAAILSSIQTFLSPIELSHRHKTAAVKYGALRHEIEAARTRFQNSFESEVSEFMDLFRIKWDSVEQESPPIPARFHGQAQKQVESSMAHLREIGAEDSGESGPKARTKGAT